MRQLGSWTPARTLRFRRFCRGGRPERGSGAVLGAIQGVRMTFLPASERTHAVVARRSWKIRRSML